MDSFIKEEDRSGILVHYDLTGSVELESKAPFTKEKLLVEYQRIVRDAMGKSGFEFIKTSGDAIIFVGTDSKALIAGFKTAKGDAERITVDKKKISFRAVAHCGAYRFTHHPETGNDISSKASNAVNFLFRMDKEGETEKIMVSQKFIDEYGGSFDPREVSFKEKCWSEPPKGILGDPGSLYIAQLPSNEVLIGEDSATETVMTAKQASEFITNETDEETFAKAIFGSLSYEKRYRDSSSKGRYFPRQIDSKINDRLSHKGWLLLEGHPLSGKTRAVFEAIKLLISSGNKVLVWPFKVPTRVDQPLTFPEFPKADYRIVWMDDIDTRFRNLKKLGYGAVEINQFLERIADAGAILVATARTGPAYYDFRHRFGLEDHL